MSKQHRHRDPADSVSRRQVLRYGIAGAGIAALGPLGRGLLPNAHGAPLLGHKRCLSMFCSGGYDGLNLVVPVTNQAYYDSRPTIQIQPGNALDIGDANYKLHPALAKVAGLYNAGDVAIFRKVGYPSANLSHFISQDIHSHGVRGEFDSLGTSTSGWIARYAERYAATPMGAAALGVGRPLEFEGGSSSPFMASSLAGFDFEDRGLSRGEHAHRLATLQSLTGGHVGDAVTTEAQGALEQGLALADQIQAAVAAYTSSSTGSTFRDAYPTNSPGRYMRDAAILIRGGFETEVFMTGLGGWDTHGSQGAETGNQATRIARMDAAIGTFVDECKDMGIWNEMLIIISSEFGRRNAENGSNGTDHGHGNMFFAIGGAVSGGLYGSDVTESDVADNNWLGYDLDYRDIFREAVGNHLGEDPGPVFPEAQDINTTLNYI